MKIAIRVLPFVAAVCLSIAPPSNAQTAIVGATITLKDATGTDVATATTDLKGHAQLPILGKGTYTVTAETPQGLAHQMLMSMLGGASGASGSSRLKSGGSSSGRASSIINMLMAVQGPGIKGGKSEFHKTLSSTNRKVSGTIAVYAAGTAAVSFTCSN